MYKIIKLDERAVENAEKKDVYKRQKLHRDTRTLKNAVLLLSLS